MPQPTVSISAPGSTTGIPCTAGGNANPSAGTIQGMAYQVNGGPVNSFNTFNPNGGPWSCQLTGNDCPQVNTTYVLIIYVGDSSGNFNSTTATFTRTS